MHNNTLLRCLASLFFPLSFSLFLLSAPSLTSFAEPPGLQVGGFIDAGSQLTDRGTSTLMGFYINEGALQLNGEWGIVQGVLDLPFTFVTGGANNLIPGLNLPKSQAFAEVRYDLGLFWRIGQFDRLWGLETNDSRGLMFTRHGILQGALPSAHLGFLAGYTFMEVISFDVMIANEDNAGSMNTGAAVGNGNAPVIAGRARFETENIIVRAGAQIQPNSTGPTDFLADIVAQILLGPISLGFESLFEDQGNGLGLGIQTELGYEFTSMIGAGLRFGYGNALESNRGFTAGGTSNGILEFRADILDAVYALTLGPHFKVNDHLQFKIDYSLTSLRPVGGAQVLRHAGNLAAVLKF